MNMMDENGIETDNKCGSNMRGKRAELIGNVCDEGIVWTNVKTGEQMIERYENLDEGN